MQNKLFGSAGPLLVFTTPRFPLLFFYVFFSSVGCVVFKSPHHVAGRQEILGRGGIWIDGLRWEVPSIYMACASKLGTAPQTPTKMTSLVGNPAGFWIFVVPNFETAPYFNIEDAFWGCLCMKTQLDWKVLINLYVRDLTTAEFSQKSGMVPL